MGFLFFEYMKNIKITLLVNETAGNGNAKTAFNKTKQVLDSKNISYKILKSTYPGELIKLAHDYAKDPHAPTDYLVVIGGDGSFNQVLNGIKSSANPDIPLAYLPAGTGNDFARAAKISNDPKKLIQSLLNKPKIEKVDCGKYRTKDSQNWSYFVNNFGIGFDAYVVHQSNHEQLKKILNKIHLGKLIYASNIVNALHSQDTFKVQVKANSVKYSFDDAYFVTTTNHPFFGGGIAILPKANLHSHVLDTVIVEKPALSKFIRLFLHLLKDGSHVNDPQFHYVEAKEISVTTKHPEYGQIDGEDTKKQPFHLQFKIDCFNFIR